MMEYVPKYSTLVKNRGPQSSSSDRVCRSCRGSVYYTNPYIASSPQTPSYVESVSSGIPSWLSPLSRALLALKCQSVFDSTLLLTSGKHMEPVIGICTWSR